MTPLLRLATEPLDPLGLDRRPPRRDLGTDACSTCELTVLAVVIGFAISFPLALLAHRHRRIYPPLTWVTGILYTIPSLALFVVLLPITGLGYTTARSAW